MEKVLEFLKKADVWYLATVDEEGNPHDYSGRSAHALKRVQRMGIAV
jgi:uncharacterized pyridoxamine 5'-phosphate oxidase family protein